MRVPAPPMWLISLLLWAGILLGVLYACEARAADDAVCKPYASALINNNMNWLWQRAFNHCKLLEEDTPIPPAPGDWRGALNILEPTPPLSEIGNTPAEDKPPSPPQRPAVAHPPRRSRRLRP